MRRCAITLLIHYLQHMKFEITSELSYEVIEPTTYFFNIQAANTVGQIIHDESISISPNLHFEEFTLQHTDTRFIKLQMNFGTFTILYKATVEVQENYIDEETLNVSVPILQLDHEVLPYIAPSRHCESDKLLKFAFKTFGHLPNEFAKAKAINEWIAQHIEYISGSTTSSTAACDTLISRQGVCKDFAHVGIALCRALDIPARYLTCYAANLYPPDIHACFEAYIANQWITFDPTLLSTNNQIVKIAHGKDASEVAVASYYGKTNCTYMNIQCEVL